MKRAGIWLGVILAVVLLVGACGSATDTTALTTTVSVTTTEAVVTPTAPSTSTTEGAVTTTTAPPTTTTAPPNHTTAALPDPLVGIRIEPEKCDGYDRDFYAKADRSTVPVTVGLFVKFVLDDRDLDHVVALKEAWCSDGRVPSVGSDADNLRWTHPQVNRGKSGHDPREWWDTNGETTPREAGYPGWCEYLGIHVDVKQKYGMSMDRAEYDFVSEQLRVCDVAPPVIWDETGVWYIWENDEDGSVEYALPALDSSPRDASASWDNSPLLVLRCDPGALAARSLLVTPWQLSNELEVELWEIDGYGVWIEYRFDTQANIVRLYGFAQGGGGVTFLGFEPQADATEMYLTIQDGSRSEWAKFDVTGIGGVMDLMSSYPHGDCRP